MKCKANCLLGLCSVIAATTTTRTATAARVYISHLSGSTKRHSLLIYIHTHARCAAIFGIDAICVVAGEALKYVWRVGAWSDVNLCIANHKDIFPFSLY